MIEKLKGFLAHEAINGLLVGIAMMIVVFLFVHFVIGIKAFS